MKTISSAVEHYIKNKPFLNDALFLDIINFTALALKIQPDIEKSLDKPVKLAALTTSLKRISEEAISKRKYRFEQVLQNISQITIRTNLRSFTHIFSATINKQLALTNVTQEHSEEFCIFSTGLNSMSVVTSNTNHFIIDDILKHKINQSPLSSLTLKVAMRNFIQDLYYYVFQIFTLENIKIVNVVSTATEFTIFLHEEDIRAALKIVKKFKDVR